MPEPIRDFAELERAIARLPPPREGWRRVFRGQDTNYPKLITSDSRSPSMPLAKIWDIALLRLHEKISPALPDDGMATLMNISHWFKVLAQHYGPGSPYLDVTSALEVALWFALNKACSPPPEFVHVVKLPGMPPIPVNCRPLYFAPHRDAPGWLYVLDVPRWDGKAELQHGDLIDLATGPDFVANCLRVQRQQGGLVFGDRHAGGGDLSGFLACAPIAVARDLAGAPFIDSPPLHVFPAPAGDGWFQQLLRAPLIAQPDDTHGFVLKQSLGVYLVAEQGRDEPVDAIISQQVAQTSALVRLRLRDEPQMRREMRAAVGADIEAATCVQLEMPLMKHMHPCAQWNQSVLAAGFASRVQPCVDGTQQLLPAVSLENVLLEFSPLEYAFEDFTRGAPICALWIVRRAEEFVFVAFDAQPHGMRGDIRGPFRARFVEASASFELSLDDAVPPPTEAALYRFRKAFFIAVEILRGLSSSIKPDACPMFSSDKDTLVAVRGRSTVLTRARTDPADVRLHFLRNAQSRQPYAGPDETLPRLATLQLPATEPYERMRSIHDIYGRVMAATERNVFVPLPERHEAGHSGEIADFLVRRYSPAS